MGVLAIMGVLGDRVGETAGDTPVTVSRQPSKVVRLICIIALTFSLYEQASP
jgi:hypothetical protein